MKKTCVILCISWLLLVFGCTNSTGPSANTPTLTLEYRSVSIPASGGIGIGITGGTPPYSVKSISDSSLISATAVLAYLRGSPPRVQIFSFNKYGSATVTLQDSTGATGVIRVVVEAFSVFPEELTMLEYSYRSISVQGGTPPYSIETGYDTTIAGFLMNRLPEVVGRKPGRTIITISDASSPKKSKMVYLTVEPRQSLSAGKFSFSSTMGARNFDGMVNPFSADRTTQGASAIGITNWNGTFESVNCIGILPRPQGQFEHAMVSLYSYGTRLVPGAYPIEVTLIGPDPRIQMVDISMSWYKSGGSEPGVTGEQFVLSQGKITISEIGSGRLKGWFYGSGYKRLGVTGLDSTKPFSVSNGMFDVPYVPDIQH